MSHLGKRKFWKDSCTQKDFEMINELTVSRSTFYFKFNLLNR